MRAEEEKLRTQAVDFAKKNNTAIMKSIGTFSEKPLALSTPKETIVEWRWMRL